MRSTVVIPVRGDAQGLRATLDALPGARVVVAVDGPDPEAERVAAQAGAIVVVLDRPSGSYAARNAAIDALPADTDVVLFTDAGCLPAAGWAAGHEAALRDAELSGGAVDVVHGPRPTPAEWVDRCRNLRQQSYVEDAGFAATCNLGVRRELLDRLRFDASLQSGGDREFCLRATASGARLVYTPAAALAHPARRTATAVLDKARRVGKGVAALPPETRPPMPKVPRPSRALARRAQAAGLPTGPVWTLRVAWLDHRRARTLRREAAQPPPIAGLHVVVLLASRWASLETMNTRWRQVVQAWAEHPDVFRVTLVDHPWFRRSMGRPLVRPGTSWLPGVELLDLTVPTRLRPARLDGVAWWRAARSLRRALPPAEHRLVVSTSSVSAPLLRHLRAPGTTTAFDAVDTSRNLSVSGDLGARLTLGYAGIAGADRATAVSQSIADGLRRWADIPVQVVPNGVRLAPYLSPAPAPDGLPDGPFAVYVGSLSSRLDLDLVERVAGLLELPVVLAGPADEPTARRLDIGPCRWLGPVPTHLVPGLLQRATVALLPHRPTDLTEAVDSMKLLEYAAAGLPIVSTPLSGLPEGAVVTRSAEEFAMAVRQAAAQPRRHEPAGWVRTRDWNEVADQMLRALHADMVDRALETVR